MIKRLASPKSVAVACGLIVLANLVILAAAGWNRRGQPRYQLSLTERELAMPGAWQEERTGLELTLLLAHESPRVVRRAARWRHYELPAIDYDWLDRAKLGELGFRVALDPAHPDAVEHYAHASTRPVHVVVEYDGEAWSRWIAGRDEEVRRLRRRVEAGTAEPSALTDAEAVLALDRTMRSRLFPVDAGTDVGELQRRHAAHRDRAVVAGLLRPKVVQSEDGEPTLRGDWSGLLVRRVHVSRALRPHLEPFLPQETWREVEARERREAEEGWPTASPPRYRADVAIGRRQEPWLVGVTRDDQGRRNGNSAKHGADSAID